MRTVLITGANRGIGLEFAQQYLADGFNVIATCRDIQKASSLTNIKSPALQVETLDVSDETSILTLAQKLSGTPIDILINNAGVYGPKYIELEAVTAEEWHRVLHINSVAPLMVARAFKANLDLGQTKTLGLLSSKMGSMDDNQSGGSYIYRSSKAALNAVGKSLANDWAHDGIKVVLLHPGWVKTEMGGPNALITTTQSVDGLKSVINNLTKSQSGQFINFDGTPIPW